MNKPKILLIPDVRGWAWWHKSQYLKKYLSDEFEFDIKLGLTEKGNYVKRDMVRGLNKKYDLYMTFGWSFVDMLKHVPMKKRITGVTAHRKDGVIKPNMMKAYWRHANSRMLFRQLKSMNLERIYYTPNGVDHEMFIQKTEINPSTPLIVGHVGKLSKMKQQKEIIEPACRLAGVQYFSHYNNYLNALPYEKMPEIYNKFDLFIVASMEDGTPCPALEAAACGRPILSNKIGNMPEFIKDGYNGWLMKECNKEAYAEKLKWIKENKKLLPEMGKNARKTVEESWSWEVQVENYRQMFRDAIKELRTTEIEKKRDRRKPKRISAKVRQVEQIPKEAKEEVKKPKRGPKIKGFGSKDENSGIVAK